MACLINACVFHIDPRGTGLIGAGPYTADTVVHNNIVRAALQELAWQTACKYNRSSLKCSMPTTIKSVQINNSSIFPNPSIDGHLNVLTQDASPFQIFDKMGKMLLSGTFVSGQNLIDCSSFTSGVYILKMNSQTHKISIL